MDKRKGCFVQKWFFHQVYLLNPEPVNSYDIVNTLSPKPQKSYASTGVITPILT